MRLFRWSITIAYAGLIFYSSSRTWQEYDSYFDIPYLDKLIHACMYAFLGALCVWCLRTTSLRGRKMLWHIGAIMAIIYGITDEIHQMFVSGRHPDPWDLLANSVGAVIGAYATIRFANWWRQREESCDHIYQVDDSEN